MRPRPAFKFKIGQIVKTTRVGWIMPADDGFGYWNEKLLIAGTDKLEAGSCGRIIDMHALDYHRPPIYWIEMDNYDRTVSIHEVSLAALSPLELLAREGQS